MDETEFYKDFKDLWVFGIECLEETARLIDERITRADGKVVPMQKLDGEILFDTDVASAHERKKQGRVQSTILYPIDSGTTTVTPLK